MKRAVWLRDTPFFSESIEGRRSLRPALMVHHRGLLGGTFDHLHAGHVELLRVGSSSCVNLEVYVTTDRMAAAKSGRMQAHRVRVEAIEEWASKADRDGVSVYPLDNEHGPAPFRDDCDAIVCTPETVPNCDAINRLRAENGLSPLELIVVEPVRGSDGEIVSSSRIRAGIIDTDGEPWLRVGEPTTTASMPTELDSDLKRPMGDLHQGGEDDPSIAIASALAGISDSKDADGPLIAVGDVTVLALLKSGIVPWVSVIDGMTQRSPWSGAASIEGASFDRTINCTNRAGTVTPSLVRACRKAVGDETTALIRVDGEEDLAPIPLLLLAPLGAHLLYGQPDEGVVVRTVDLAAKRRARSLLDAFEQRGPNG